jgi:hypothetical protein
MSTHLPKLSLDQVLESFAMEHDADGQALRRYLQEYPEYAPQLVDLSQEIFRFDIRIQSAPTKAVTDLFADLSVPKLREVAQTLDVPRQVITAFRERAVIVASIPMRFLTKLAGLLGSSVQDLQDSLSLPPQAQARSYKADGKPSEAARVTFEQLLRDAGQSDEQIELLLADDV